MKADIIKKISELKQLLDSGVLTREEFEYQKKKLLAPPEKSEKMIKTVKDSSSVATDMIKKETDFIGSCKSVISAIYDFIKVFLNKLTGISIFKQGFRSPAKKYVYIGVAALLVISGVYWYYLEHRLDTCILEELSESTVIDINDENPGFKSMYSLINAKRKELNNMRGQVEETTYRDVLDYSRKYFGNKRFCDSVYNIGVKEHDIKVYATISNQVDALVAKWRVYQKDHDMNNYIDVSVKTCYAYSGWHTYPAIYFSADIREDVVNGSVKIIIVSNDGREKEEYVETLSRVFSHQSSSDALRVTDESNFNQDYWDKHVVKVVPYSVQLSNRTIHANDMDNIPQNVRLYMDNAQNEQNKTDMIKTYIDPQYKGQSEYAKEFLQNKLKRTNLSCYNVAYLVGLDKGHASL